MPDHDQPSHDDDETETDARDAGRQDVQEVGPRTAPGNTGWNEPVDDAPETIERAVRSDRGAEEE